MIHLDFCCHRDVSLHPLMIRLCMVKLKTSLRVHQDKLVSSCRLTEHAARLRPLPLRKVPSITDVYSRPDEG